MLASQTLEKVENIYQLNFENKKYRHWADLSIREVDGKIKYIHTAAFVPDDIANMPYEQRMKPPPQYEIIDCFSYDFAERVQTISDKPSTFKEPLFNQFKVYQFGEYTVRLVSEWKIECRLAAADEVLWELRLTAWLYTEFEEKDGIIYFGTAGKGGHFYAISLSDGRVIFDINTGGTTQIVRTDDYFVIVDRKRDLVLIDSSGAEVKRFHFKKMYAQCSMPVLIRDNKLYTFLTGKTGWLLYAVCVEYNDCDSLFYF